MSKLTTTYLVLGFAPAKESLGGSWASVYTVNHSSTFLDVSCRFRCSQNQYIPLRGRRVPGDTFACLPIVKPKTLDSSFSMREKAALI